MGFKSDKQPLCRYCGEKIPKRTDLVYVHATPPRTHIPETKISLISSGKFKEEPTGKMIPIHVSPHVIGIPRTKEEAQKLINLKIISVRKGDDGVISRLGVWDGETYNDQFFCKNDCAIRYAYSMVRSPHNSLVMPAYTEALAKESV